MTTQQAVPSTKDIAIFNNNPKLKALGQKYPYTQEQQLEIIKCRRDIVYFAMNYCKIVHIDKGLINFDPYPYQVKMLKHMQDNRFSILKTGRQMGKTTTSAIFLLWYTLFNRRKTIGLLANKGSLAQEILTRYQDMYQELPLWLQQGIISWNKQSLELENKSRIISASTSSSAARGFSFSVLYIDELAFVPHNVWESFYTSVYPTISSGEESRIILTSTPNGMNHFWQMWEAANLPEGHKNKSNYAPFGAIWSDVPWRDETWKMREIANTSNQQFEQEHEASFLGSSSTLISASALESMIINSPLMIRKDDCKIFKKPIPGHKYIMTADTSRGYKQDYSTFCVFDVTSEPYEIVATFRNNKIDPLYFSHFINFYGRTYNYAHVLVEINDAGGQVVDNLFHEHDYDNIIMTNRDKKTGNEMITNKSKGSRRGVYTSKTVKSRGCTVLKSIIEGNMLLINDENIQSEALHFVRHKTSWAAEEGYHDDLMMNLVLFAWLSTQHTFGQILDDVDVLHYARGRQMAEDYNILPQIIMPDDIVYEDNAGWIKVEQENHGFNYDSYTDLYKKW